jgi:hypothetical protein
MPGLARFMLGSTYDTLREAARDHPVVVLVTARGRVYALIMSGEAEEEPHALRLELTSRDLLALREFAQESGLRSRAAARLRVRICKMDTDIQTFRVLADLWRKIVKPVMNYLGLEVRGDKSMHFSPVDTS